MTAQAENQTGPDNWVPTTDTFGMRLAMIRHMKGWNQKEAALACGLPAASWRGWELHDRLPRDVVQVCQRIADITGVDWQWLLAGKASADASPLGGSNSRPLAYNLIPVACENSTSSPRLRAVRDERIARNAAPVYVLRSHERRRA